MLKTPKNIQSRIKQNFKQDSFHKQSIQSKYFQKMRNIEKKFIIRIQLKV